MFGYQLVSANRPPGKSEDRVSCPATSISIPPEPPSKPSLAWSLASQPRTPSTQIPCLVASNEGQPRYQLRSCGARCRPRQCPPTLLETTATTPHGQPRFRRAVFRHLSHPARHLTQPCQPSVTQPLVPAHKNFVGPTQMVQPHWARGRPHTRPNTGTA